MKSQTILLVEDDKFVSKAYSFFLKKEGYNVLYAADGEEGLKILKGSKPDLILLDLIMPGMNGFEMLKALKSKKVTREIPVIIVSNLGQESDIQECKRLGAADYLIKADLYMKDVLVKIKTHIGVEA